MAIGHVFDDPKKKEEMLAYRMAGYSYPQLALHYGVDHTTLIYHVRKAGFVKIDKKKKDEIVKLMKGGADMKDVSKKYGISQVAISSYCCQAGLKGFKILSNEKKLVLSVGPPRTRIRHVYNGKIHDRKNRTWPQYDIRPPKSPRPGWLFYGGEWICAGKPIEQIQAERKEKEKKIQEQERMDMLKY